MDMDTATDTRQLDRYSIVTLIFFVIVLSPCAFRLFPFPHATPAARLPSEYVLQVTNC